MRLAEQMVVIMLSKPQKGKCESCGKLEQEIRPYGENNALICEECAKKDEDNIKKRFDNIVQAAVAAQREQEPVEDDTPHPFFKQAIEHPGEVTTKMMQDSIFRLTHPLYEITPPKNKPPIGG